MAAKENFGFEATLVKPRPPERVGGRVNVVRPTLQELRLLATTDDELKGVIRKLRNANIQTDQETQNRLVNEAEEEVIEHMFDAQDALDAAGVGTPEETTAAEKLADWTYLQNIIRDIRDTGAKTAKENEKQVIDYRDPWNSWAKIMGWLKEGEDPKDPAIIERMTQDFFNWLMETILKRFWDNPNNKEQLGWLDFLGSGWEMQGGESRLTLDSLVNGFPGNQNHMRDRINLISHSFQGGIGWHQLALAKENGPHEKVIEHLTHHLFGGTQWQELAELPKMAEDEKSLGDLTFEGLDWYSHWNEKFVLASKAERTAIAQTVDRKIAARAPGYVIPSRDVVVGAFERANKKPSDLFAFGMEQATDQEVIYLFGLVERDYTKFVTSLRNHMVRKLIKTTNANRQEKKGIFPLLDVSEVRFGVDAFGERKTQRDVYRTEIAIAIGCYNLGLGEYAIQIDNDGNITRELYEDEAHTRRINLTPGEFQALIAHAFDKGRAAELLAFHVYESNMGSSHDDNATFLATTKPTRVLYTRDYRLRYPGQEGVWNKEQFVSLVPKVFDYMAADGISLKKLFHDRHQRVHAKYEAMQEVSKKYYYELYAFAAVMYDILDLGLQRGVKGFSLTKLGEFIVTNRYATDEQLSVKTEEIDELTDFWRKTIGYWLDPRLLIDESQMTTGVYDPDVWGLIEGTNLDKNGNVVPNKGVRSPLFSKNMLHFDEEDMEKIKADILAKGNNKKAVKLALQKAILASMTYESLLLLGSEYLTHAEREALLFAYSGDTDYKVRQGAVGDSAVPGYGFSRGEIVDMLRRSGKVRDGYGYALLSALTTSSRT